MIALRGFTDLESGMLSITAEVYRIDGWLVEPKGTLGWRDFFTLACELEHGEAFYANVTVPNKADIGKQRKETMAAISI
eukprot:CAMPEP_0119340512 /NCGR_PEP_ID=MMETSP1333-20130426/100536_1 /TAXON_ID=418940 /ORGANISM="Scyphosphaera apsteinii, Strain RCC1455" /LENGTH=78 /DNA_ID=CAMNT_0007352277 /DNA_START=370 /DNA_END=606 /DNA_ORIENTATION=-